MNNSNKLSSQWHTASEVLVSIKPSNESGLEVPDSHFTLCHTY